LRIIGEPSEADKLLLKQLKIEYSAQSKLTDVEMQHAYATSDFLLFASTLEGFGMPIIEAQMVGLPVITSNIDPMREVAGSGALLCNPLDKINIRNCILSLLKNDDSSLTITHEGLQNSVRFQPLSAAVMHQELYERLGLSVNSN